MKTLEIRFKMLEIPTSSATEVQMLMFVMQDNYDSAFEQKVYSSAPLSASEVMSGLRPSRDSTIRVQYNDLASFKAAAKLLGIMDDVKVCPLHTDVHCKQGLKHRRHTKKPTGFYCVNPPQTCLLF